MKEKLTHLKDKAREALADPVNQERAIEAASEVGGAVIGHVMDEFTKEKKDGTRKLRKFKTAKALLRPVHTARTVAHGAGRAGFEAGKSVARDTAIAAAKGQLGRGHMIPVQSEGHIEQIAIHADPGDEPPWADVAMPLSGAHEQQPGDEVIPWDDLPPAMVKPGSHHDDPPWHDEDLPPLI